MDDSKYCCRCKLTLPITVFAKCARKKDGLQSWCDTCRHEHYEAHKAERHAHGLAYREARRVELCEQQKQYYIGHAEQVKEYQRQYRQTAKGKAASKAKKSKRRLQARTAGGTHTAKQLLEQLQRQKHKCYYCMAKLYKEWHPDHVVPLNRGGSNDISNIVIACPECNMHKHDRLPHEWPKGNRLL